MTQDLHTVADSLAWSMPILASAGVGTPRLDAQLLLSWTMDARREDLARAPERILTSREWMIFAKAVSLRAERRPLPYITGEAWFFGRSFKVNRAVLIPRPETEILVENVLDVAGRQNQGRPMRIADIGAGSGCIAVTLACELPDSTVVATDISRLALLVAGKNARRHSVSDRIELREGSLLDPFRANEKFDAIVSNPPYIERYDEPGLMPEVRDYEPELALYGYSAARPPCDQSAGYPRSLRNRLLESAHSHIAIGGIIAVEVGIGQAQEAAQDAIRLGYRNVQVVDDIAGIGRVVTAQV